MIETLLPGDSDDRLEESSICQICFEKRNFVISGSVIRHNILSRCHIMIHLDQQLFGVPWRMYARPNRDDIFSGQKLRQWETPAAQYPEKYWFSSTLHA
jgi:hypothetical protein